MAEPQPPLQPPAVPAAVLARYAALPRTGKPQGSEWTLLAGAVLERPGQEPRCVALATGTKCLPASARTSDPLALADSHAEVLCRRALQCWLYAELRRARNGDDGAALVPACGGRFRMRDGARLHMYVSAPPCGDAAVGLAEGTGDDAGEEGPGAPVAQRLRTGAKRTDETPPAPGDTWAEANGAAQAEGKCRRKPGRGEPTLSMSCSDKLARWAFVGVQGALLDGLLAAPVKFATLTVAAPPAARDSAAHLAPLARALGGRLAPVAPRLADTPHALLTPVLHAAPPPPPELATGDGSRKPCGFSVNWSEDLAAPGGGVHEVTLGVTGRRGGAGKKAAASPKTLSRLGRGAMLARFAAAGGCCDAGCGYGDLKRRSTDYASASAALLAVPSPLSGWIAKPVELAAAVAPLP